MKQKKMTTLFKCTGCLILLSMVFVLFANMSEAQTIKLKYGSYAPQSVIDDPILWYINEVSKRSGVKINVETYFGGTLAKPMDCLDAIGKGVYDIGWISSVFTPAKNPLAVIPNATPLVAPTLYNASKAADVLLQTLPAAAEEFKKANLKVLFHTGVWNYKLISTKPVKSLEDIKGLKVRTFGYLSKAWAELGGVPVSIPISETYDALQKGTIDGALTQPVPMYKSLRLSEIAKNYFNIDLGCLAAPVVMNSDTYKKLPEVVRKEMQNLGNDMPRMVDQIVGKLELEAIKNMEKAGVRIYEPSATDKARIREVTKLVSKMVVDDLLSKNVSKAQEAMDIYINTIDKYPR